MTVPVLPEPTDEMVGDVYIGGLSPQDAVDKIAWELKVEFDEALDLYCDNVAVTDA